MKSDKRKKKLASGIVSPDDRELTDTKGGLGAWVPQTGSVDNTLEEDNEQELYEQAYNSNWEM